MSFQLKIQEPFYERYTMLVQSDMKAVNVTMQSVVQIRWDFRVLTVIDDQLEIELLLLDHILLESNNPLIKEIASMSQIFGRMYSELHLIIDHKGKVLQVLNMELIKSKWAQTKKEMSAVAENTPEIKNVIALNDGIFQNEAKLIAGIQGSEFFMVYFNEVYANNLPFYKSNIQKNNFFNTNNILWEYEVSSSTTAQPDGIAMIQLNAVPSYSPNESFNKIAYSQFAELIDIPKLKPILNEQGTYTIQTVNGKLLEAILQRDEIADSEKLFTKMTYTLTADNKNNISKRQVSFGNQNKATEKSKRFDFLNV